ncbi:ATP-binding protein [Sporofaciens musculi]|uniref:ATP-binding protein n=1 Tax=Sporofaciens musculi TaxID=2681861 RepID=UPI0025702EAD|nr:ATP-binding protein [Sporofaciens musculi]
MEREETVGADGFLHCSICGEAVEREINMPFQDGPDGQRKRVRCVCRCQREEKEAYEARIRFEEEQRTIDNLRQLSLMDASLKGARFANYKVTEENRRAYGIAKRYVENFNQMFSEGQGILFWGNVGTGKSYTAAAIANELLEQMQSVIMTSFIKLLDEMSGFEKKDDCGYIIKLNQAKLLIVDDLGAERGTDFSLEKVYDIIDSRHRTGKPIILTTNQEISQMKSCEDIRYSRIYDRIFKMCYPVKMDGMSWRKRDAAKRFAEMKNLLEG